jgi:hypothetical protein
MRSSRDVAHARLHNQRIASGGFSRPEDVVSWLGAVQAQDYPGAKWALALRMRRRIVDADVERAFAAGAILRTHVMRPTWHFVAPADIRWLLSLTAPRVRVALSSYDRRLELDAAVVKRSNKTIARALVGGAHLTRQELRAALQKAGIAADGVQRLAHLAVHAELDGVICSGPLRGKQFTYALLDERVPAQPALPRDEALAELTRRYFTSHGPAQLRDFVWWSGLRTSDARAGLEMAQSRLAEEVIDGKQYWFSSSMRTLAPPPRTAYLLPLYDEYLIAYRDKSASIDSALWMPVVARDPFSSAILLDGQVVGGWKRTLLREKVVIAVDLPGPIKKVDERLVVDATQRFGAFLGVDATVVRR